jgi:hypothetical protein
LEAEDLDPDIGDREFEIYYHFPCWMKMAAEKDLNRAVDNQGLKAVMPYPVRSTLLSRRRVPNKVRGQRRGQTARRGNYRQPLQRTWPR